MKGVKLVAVIIGLVSYSNLSAISFDLEHQKSYKVDNEIHNSKIGIDLINMEVEIVSLSKFDTNQTITIKKKKFIAITLAVTLGVFGVHRLYLGTSTKVPIIYTLTLGGGFGVLVVSDIIAIIATKNLDKYSPNTKAFMWAE